MRYKNIFFEFALIENFQDAFLSTHTFVKFALTIRKRLIYIDRMEEGKNIKKSR